VSTPQSNEDVPAMDPETLEALRGSIAKWEGIVAGTVENKGAENCPLCQKFHPDYNPNILNCDGCPVKAKTRIGGCIDTPYTTYSEAEFEGDISDQELRVLAKDELDFLKSLLPSEAVSALDGVPK